MSIWTLLCIQPTSTGRVICGRAGSKLLGSKIRVPRTPIDNEEVAGGQIEEPGHYIYPLTWGRPIPKSALKGRTRARERLIRSEVDENVED